MCLFLNYLANCDSVDLENRYSLKREGAETLLCVDLANPVLRSFREGNTDDCSSKFAHSAVFVIAFAAVFEEANAVNDCAYGEGREDVLHELKIAHSPHFHNHYLTFFFMRLPMFRNETEKRSTTIFMPNANQMNPPHFRKNALRAWARYGGGTIFSVHHSQINHLKLRRKRSTTPLKTIINHPPISKNRAMTI